MSDLASQGNLKSSFRDPSGQFVADGGRAFRVITRHGLGDLSAIEASDTVAQYQRDGRLIGAIRCDLADLPERVRDLADDGPVLEHPLIDFVTYPSEWTPTMLWDAARLTIDLAIDLLDEGLGLKDATPSNVLWRGSTPVFVDLMSIEQRDPTNPIWHADGQYARTFLIPLAADRYVGLGLDQVFLADREGLSPDALVRLLPWYRCWLPPVVGIATLPTKLSKEGAGRQAVSSLRVENEKKAAFMLTATLKRQRRRLEALKPSQHSRTDWSTYGPRRHYSEAALAMKEAFVKEALARVAAEAVIDLGCNDGSFSKMAATAGARVVATDLDMPSLEHVYQNAKKEGLNIQPVRINLAQPSPAAGWRGCERQSFDSRTSEAFDAVLALAVIHHLQIAERIPLGEIAAWIAGMTRDAAIVEYVDPEDPMAKGLITAHDAPVDDLGLDAFRRVFGEWFEIEQEAPLTDMKRQMFLLRKRT